MMALVHVKVELGHIHEEGGHGWMLDSVRELAEGVLEEGRHGCQICGWVLLPGA
jgi:hypothetical protein